MGTVLPFAAIRYRARVLDELLAPPYDVISAQQQRALYGRDTHNIVRIDFAPGEDPYPVAAETLRQWLNTGHLRADDAEAYYILAHEFPDPNGGRKVRWGVFAKVPALPWEQSEIQPHERTLRGPKEDRLKLMRATKTQTSPVFCMAAGVSLRDHLARYQEAPVAASANFGGELGEENLSLWVDTTPVSISRLTELLAAARLYIADGHHRFETGVTYGQEQGNLAYNLIYVCAADDPGLTVLPIHRLMAPSGQLPSSVSALQALLPPYVLAQPAASLEVAQLQTQNADSSNHRIAVIAGDGITVLTIPRASAPGAEPQLAVTALEGAVLQPIGLDRSAIERGALTYSRDAGEVARRVAGGEAGLGFLLPPTAVSDVIRTADAAAVMPQKSTYFYPKVPTGLVLFPL